MTITTDPRTVTTGPVQISATSTARRDALVGRWVAYRTWQDGIRVGQVERLNGIVATVRFPDGRWAGAGRILDLVPEPDETGLSPEVLESFDRVCQASTDRELCDWAVSSSRGVDDATPLPTYQARVAILSRIHAEQERRRSQAVSVR